MKREIERLAARYDLGPGAVERFSALLRALASEPDPPTTIRDPPEALDRHLADSLEALRLPGVRDAGRIADVGAGAGFPGLALAVALPGAEVDLIESQARKCDVIERLALAAGAGNASAVRLRAEEWAAGAGAGRYGVVTARAVAALPVLLEYAAPLLLAGGRFVAWKGARDREEETAAARVAALLGLEPSEVRQVRPFAGARNRHLHVYTKVEETPDLVPRRPGVAARRPLA